LDSFCTVLVNRFSAPSLASMSSSSSSPYRSSSTSALGFQPARSLRDISGVDFIAMPEFEGVACVDMYGDLPYGLFVLPDAVVRGDAGYIFTEEGVPIVEQNADFLRKERFLRPRFEDVGAPSLDRLGVERLISLKARCHTGFFHWALGALPKVFLAECSGFDGSYLLPPRSLAPWAPESMRMLNIADNRLVFEEMCDIAVRRLYVPTYFSGYNAHHNIAFMKLYREWVRAVVAGRKYKKGERIFIARRESTKVRRVLNQEQGEQVLTEYGFKTIYCEELSFRQQIEIAVCAEAIVAPHGAGLSHALFMDENSLVVELFPFKRQQSCDCFEMLSRIPSHRYIALESKTPCEGDVDIDLQKLRDVLGRALI
jgi:capsular polysaccharide biosynthesis protein